MPNQPRILRNFRNMPPTKFHGFNEKVRIGLTNNPKIPESSFAANPTLLATYFAITEKYNAVYHESMYGSKLAIGEREILQAQLVSYLNEIASILEAAAVRNPEILLSSGFDLAKDRRGHGRSKSASTDTKEVKSDTEETQK